MIDDTLILGYNATTGRLLGAADVAMSYSTLSMFKEDPMRYYLRKVLGLPDPPTVALAWGQAGHAALDVLFTTRGDAELRVRAAMGRFVEMLQEELARVPDLSVMVNTEDPANPRNRERVEVSFDGLRAEADEQLTPLFRMLVAGYDTYTPLRVFGNQVPQIERQLGEAAAERGMPTVSMRIWDARQKKKVAAPVAVVAGVPFNGFVDAIFTWEDESEFIVDHKFVSSMVPIYPPVYQGQRFAQYPPSYNPASDPQLDLYAYATGVERIGFQFFTKNPQMVPPNGVLMDGWMDERDWKRRASIRTELPAMYAASPDGKLRYGLVWRPAPTDHPSSPTLWTRPFVSSRILTYVRDGVERLTESYLLWKSGVEPELAFLAGDPADIAKKACPTCLYGVGGQCPTPRNVASAEEAYQRALHRREVLCRSNHDILQRRQEWTKLRTAA